MEATIHIFRPRHRSPRIHEETSEEPLRRSRRCEDLHAFLVDLEREHGVKHRQVLEVLYGLSDDPAAEAELGREARESPLRLQKIVAQALMFGHKWFGLPEADSAA
ncbi:MAG: hypothetical protein U0166_03115 [Acidobacteriota bacterium]